MNGSLKLYNEAGHLAFNGPADGHVDTGAIKLDPGKYWGDFGFPLIEPVLTLPAMPSSPPAAVTNCPRLAFSDTFNPGVWPAISRELSNHGPIVPPVRWVCHPPYGPDFATAGYFGDEFNAATATPWGNNGPYGADNGCLEIHAFTVSDGSWRCGLLSSADSKGGGFSAKAPSFWDCCMWVPPLAWDDPANTPGLWPAFWLAGLNGISTAPGAGGDSAEIDVMEANSVGYTKFSQTWHVWNGGKQMGAWGNEVNVGSDLSAGFHRFSVWIDHDLTHWFFDGVETWSYATQPSFLLPLYCMIDFSLGGGWPVNIGRANNYVMKVPYVACWTS